MPAPRRLVLAPLLLALAGLPAAADEAGIAGAVNVDVDGTPPGGATSVLEVGRVIVRDEHIRSNANGLAQLLFLDQTTLTVGPNSDIVIDEFVYDPATKDGQLLMQASVGVFRLIGGETATSGGITVGTPFATMGIRGSNIVIEISPNGRTRVTCNYCEAVEIQLLSDPDNLVTIFGSDRFRTIEIGPDGFSAPFTLTAEEIALLQTALTSRPGQNGGTATIPSEPQVTQNVANNSNSGNPPGQNNPNNPTPAEQGYSDQLIPNPQEQTEAGQNRNEQEAEGGDGGGGPTLLFTGGNFIAPPGGEGGGPLGPLDVGEGGAYGGWTGDLDDPEHTQSIVGASLQGGNLRLALAGGQSFNVPWQAGSFAFEQAGGSPAGGTLSGEGFVAPGGDFFFYTLRSDQNGADSLLYGGRALDSFEGFQQYMAWDLSADPLNSNVPFLYGEVPGSVVSPLYFASNEVDGGSPAGTYGVAALSLEGTGPDQSTMLMVTILRSEEPLSPGAAPTIDGQVRAFASWPYGTPPGVAGGNTIVTLGNVGSIPDSDGNAFYGGPDGAYFVLGSGKWNSRDNDDVPSAFGTSAPASPPYEPVHFAKPSAEGLPAGFGQETAGFQHSGYAAGVADLNGDEGYVGLVGSLGMAFNTEATNYAILELGTLENNTSSFNYDDVEIGFGGGLFIDRSRIMLQEDYAEFEGAEVSDLLGAFVSYELVRLPGNTLPGGATACACAFMEWGFWAADLYEGGEPSGVATIPLGTWVAGEQIDIDDLPTNGSASYEGHAIANIMNTVDGVTASYVAAGALTMEVDFASQSISGGVAGLDGRDYAFSADYYNWAGANYQTYGQSTDGEIDIQMNGGFFAGPQGPAQGVGGNFTLAPNELSDLDYFGTGTYMGEQVPQ